MKYTYQPFRNHPWVSPLPVRKGVSPAHYKCPLPRNDADFAILSEVIFGVPLTLKSLQVSWGPFERTHLVDDRECSHLILGAGYAEIDYRYDDFETISGDFSKYSPLGHYRLEWLWQTAIGPMDSSRSLTQTSIRVLTHRNKRRLEAWIKDRSQKRGSPPSPAFVRLAHKHGVGENNLDGNRPPERVVLTGGRVDAAPAGFAAQYVEVK